MLLEEVIWLANTEYASPIVFVPRKDGTLRFCVGYRTLNAVAERDLYPLPGMDEFIDSLGESRMFPIFYDISVYWRIEIDERNISKTVFTSHHGLFQFVRPPFCLKNDPVPFQ